MSDELRRKLKSWYNECRDIERLYRSGDLTIQYHLFDLPPFPQECVGLECGAKARSGNPCRIKELYRSGRCKFHGGLSTGPKTLEGKRKSALNTGKTYEELLLSRNRDE
jgi:hypothetical protein